MGVVQVNHALGGEVDMMEERDEAPVEWNHKPPFDILDQCLESLPRGLVDCLVVAIGIERLEIPLRRGEGALLGDTHHENIPEPEESWGREHWAE